MKACTKIKLIGGLFGALLLSAPTFAGTYANIVIDGDFSDWAGVPVLTTDTIGDGDPVDYVTLYAANNDDSLFLRVVYGSAVTANAGDAQIYIAIDNDNNPATGFDVLGLGLIGSEIGWQNDFPFQQATGVFNTGGGVTDGGASIAPFGVSTTEQEIGIGRSATFTIGGGSIFPNDTIGLAMYTPGVTTDDFIGTGVYTFAVVPEPGHYAMIMLGATGLIVLIRRRIRA